MLLTDLPNVGLKLAENLRRVGLETPEDFRKAGAREAFLRILSLIHISEPTRPY